MKKLLTFLMFFLLASTHLWAAKITDKSNIVSGKKYYIGATTSSTDYYLRVDGTTTSTSVAGTAVTAKNDATVFVFTSSETKWTIKFDGTDNYLSLNSSKDNGKVMVTNSSSDFTIENTDKSLIAIYRGSYFIQKNNSGTQFGSYGNTQTNVWLEEVEETPVNPYTVTLSDGGTLTEASAGAGVTLPSRSDVGDWKFAGWSETNVSTQTETAPTIISAGLYKPTANVALYPVYSKTEGTGGTAKKTSGLTASTTAQALESDKPVTYKMSAKNNYSDPLRVYQNNILTIACTGTDNITKIVLAGTDGSYKATKLTLNTGQSGEISKQETSPYTVTWTGSSKSVQFMAEAQARVSTIEVTYGNQKTYYLSTPVAPVVKTITALEVSGTPTKTTYNVGDAFEPAGLVVTGTYSDGTKETITEGITWNVTPQKLTAGLTSVSVTATVGEITSEAYVVNELTVNKKTASISVEPSSVTVRATKTATVTVTVTPEDYDGELSVTSNSVATATIDGKAITVTGVAEGSATLTVTGAETATYGAISTTIDVTVKGVVNAIFYESFDNNSGTGGNDNQWSGNIAAKDIKFDNADWDCVSGKGAKECAKFGAGSTQGSATTPALGYEGDAVLYFKAAAWDGDEKTLNLSISGENTQIKTTSVTLKNSEWTEYAVTLTGLKENSKITFEAANARNNRFFLDEVMVMVVEEVPELGDFEKVTASNKAVLIDGDLEVVAVSDNFAWVRDNSDSYAKVENNGYKIGNPMTMNENYTQNNWLKLVFDSEDETIKSVAEGKVINNVKGVYSGNPYYSHEIKVASCEVSGSEKTTTRNIYTIANFNNGINLETGVKKYNNVETFFMTPKAEEVCTITYAYWDGNTFVMPNKETTYVVNGENVTGLNPNGYEGSIAVDWSKNGDDFSAPGEQESTLYEFTAIVTRTAPAQAAPAHDASKAPATGGYTIYPVGFSFENGVVTGVEDLNVSRVNGSKAVKMIENGRVVIIKDGKKFNIMGQPVL